MPRVWTARWSAVWPAAAARSINPDGASYAEAAAHAAPNYRAALTALLEEY